MMFSETAVSNMTETDRQYEENAKRWGWIKPGDSYGFIIRSRNSQTGAIHFSEHTYETRAAALLAAYSELRSASFLFEAVERSRTCFEPNHSDKGR